MSRKGRRIVAALVLGGTILVTAWGLWIIRPVLAPFLIAVLIAYLVAPSVHAMARLGLTRAWAILAIYLILALVSSIALWKVVPQVVSQTRRLTEAIPVYSVHARQLVDAFQQRVKDLGIPPEMREMLDRHISDFELRSVEALDGLLSIETLKLAAGLLASLILAPFLAFYLLRDMERFKERAILSLPVRYRREILGLLRGLDRVLSGFVRGQVILAVIVGSLAATATALLGLRYSLLLGIWAGLTEFVPYVGPILGAIPAVLAGLSLSPLLALETVLAFAAIQQLENAILSPKIMGESIGLHPLVVMLSVLAGGYLLGTWGLILALPIAGVTRVFCAFILERLTEV